MSRTEDEGAEAPAGGGSVEAPAGGGSVEARAERPPRQHELKCWRPYFLEIASGRKTFEIRRDDRGFQVGDTLMLIEWDEATSKRTGYFLTATVGYVLRAPLPFDPSGEGLGPEWVVMSLRDLRGYRMERFDG